MAAAKLKPETLDKLAAACLVIMPWAQRRVVQYHVDLKRRAAQFKLLKGMTVAKFMP